MKNRKKTVVVTAMSLILLAACSGRESIKAAAEEMVVPEMSSEELLATSLEYLLLEDEENLKNPVSVQHESETPGDAKIQLVSEDREKEAGAVVYYGKGGSADLKQEVIAVEAVTATELIDALAKHNIVSLDTKVLAFEKETIDGKVVLHLDLSRAAGEYLRTMSKEAECIIVSSISNTFLENYEADALYLTVEGEPVKLSGEEYTAALEKCTPDELERFID